MIRIFFPMLPIPAGKAACLMEIKLLPSRV
jgi:hypothetical protein